MLHMVRVIFHTIAVHSRSLCLTPAASHLIAHCACSILSSYKYLKCIYVSIMKNAITMTFLLCRRSFLNKQPYFFYFFKRSEKLAVFPVAAAELKLYFFYIYKVVAVKMFI